MERIVNFKNYFLKKILDGLEYINGIKFIFTKHSLERIKERNIFDDNQLKEFFEKIALKLKEFYNKNLSKYILFFSNKLKQGVVGYYEKENPNTFKIITFLPNQKGFANPGTLKVFIEEIENKEINEDIEIVYID